MGQYLPNLNTGETITPTEMRTNVNDIIKLDLVRSKSDIVYMK